ncbi:MAG: hypothetical protein AAGI70_17205 [Pseudomonadota bacterium]
MKPGDFQIGVLEFFAILLPGSVLLGYLVMTSALGPLLALFPLENETAQYAGFLLGAYALGHLVFLAASQLDWIFYKHVRHWIWPDPPGGVYEVAGKLRRDHVGGTEKEPMNTFKWCQTYLLQNKPAAAAEVRRFEADSKFFRSLALLLALLCPLLALERGEALLAVLSGVASLACLGRYAEQRHKSTDTAYRHIVVLCTPSPFRRRPARPTPPPVS